ncbi:MAG: hydroxymethylpyrimidine/phosphomethylpyrimidine kinase [Pseudomonadota bacterium]|nr:MAG: hydroxymethylpyrimidine/phosphomethylpyrimidine kinase [Pseudomonadota bacterium]
MTVVAPPIVLVFAGSDPTGGAGIAADVLTLASLGCHAAPVVTAVTAQDTSGVKQFDIVPPELVIAQARAVLEDMPVAAIKTGMLASSVTVAAIEGILRDYPRVPVVVDPVQASGGGDDLCDEPLDEVLRSLLIPRARLVTPNSLEVRALAPGADTLDACAQDLMSLGAEFVLITGTHEPTPKVQHRLYGQHRLLETFSFERLPKNYHGSGCTLAAACAGVLAHGLDTVSAITQATRYTYECLRHAYRAGMGQLLPDRLYWGRETLHKQNA